MTLWQRTAAALLSAASAEPVDRAAAERPPLPRPGVERQRALRLHQAELSADRALDARRRAEGRGARRRDRAQGRFLYAAIRRRDRAVEFRADQSRGAARDDRERAARIWSTASKNLLDDLERGKGRLAITMTDMAAFRIGENIAATPGKVVYQNDLMQLIQYAPTTETVKRRPLLIIPPWINKFYILDLRPRELVHPLGGRARATRCSSISWVNPDARLARQELRGLHARGAARRARRDASRRPASARPTSSAIASAARCWPRRSPIWPPNATTGSRARRFSSRWSISPRPASSRVFIDEEQLAALEERMSEKGYLEAPRHGARPSTCCAPTT